MTLACAILALMASADNNAPADSDSAADTSAPIAAPLATDDDKDATPAPVGAVASVDKAVATTGDLITFSVTVTYGTEWQVTVREPGAKIAGLRVIDAGHEPPEEEAGQFTERWWYTVRGDLVGHYIIPPVTVTYSPKSGDAEEKTVQTSQIFVEIESVLPTDGTATDIRDIKPLVRVAPALPWWIFVLIGVVSSFAIGIAVFFYLRRRRRVSVPATPPYEIALAALDELRKTDFSDITAVREYYFQVSLVLRAYVEGSFSLNATDLTTEEILIRLSELDQLSEAERRALRAFLRATDEVKFAEHKPSTTEIEETYEHALRFVETTCPAELEESAPPS